MQEDLKNGVVLIPGDCLEVLKTLPDNSVDSVVTDPPYHLISAGGGTRSNMADLVKQPDNRGPHYKRLSAGFMGKKWDGGDIAFRPELWREVLRVIRPGGHLLSFGGTRTYHRMVCAIEDAGFEIRDQIQWVYGSGFCKNRDPWRLEMKAKVESALLAHGVTGVIEWK